MSEPGYIMKLDDSVIHKIAAGEIITEPVNVVKELLENSIDAVADHIQINIENGGYGLIQIKDDGTGIRKSDMPLACARHTTSKLHKYNDLRTIGTFGFRGEALFSMSCCAHVTITTKTFQEEYGYSAEYSDGKMSSDLKNIAATEGTTVEVRDLFYNNRLRLNARPKATTDAKKIYEVVAKYAVTYPELSFVLSSNGKEMLQTYGGSKTEDVLKLLFDIEDTKSIFTLSFSPYPNVTATMFLSAPSFSSKKKMNAIFINGRLVQCQSFKHSIDTAYSETVGSGVSPFYFIILVMPQENVEVNVHPSKKTVKFIGEVEIGEEIHKKIKESLEQRRGSRPVMLMKERTHKTSQKPTDSPQIDKFISQISQKPAEDAPPLSQRDKARQMLGLPLLDAPSNEKSTNEEPEKHEEEERPIAPPSYKPPEENKPQEPQNFLSESDDEKSEVKNEPKVEEPVTQDLPKPNIPVENTHFSDDSDENQFFLPKVPKSVKKNTLNTEKAPKKSSTSDTRYNLFAELKYKPKVVSAAEQGMKTLEQLLTPPTVIAKPFRNVELQSVLEMRRNFTENSSKTLTEILKGHSFLGFCDISNFLISFGDGLYLCNTFGVVKDLFVKLILDKFQNFPQLRLDKPIDIAQTVSILGNDGEKAVQTLENNSAMLMDYFSISIENGKLYSMPSIVSNYRPTYSAMPLFLSNIVNNVDWENEIQCLSTLIDEIASVSSPIPDDGNDKEVEMKLMNQIGSLVLPVMKEESFVASMDATESVMKLYTAASLFDKFNQ
ncbi:DNA mismatch repair protein, putative [Trichomonas vaginalis G3]|uniref:DNA mismatch repair protein, putative n=1 Tax=Trichomonas vaginalis (strain ATCC PRA-98 / G3) TaxID=412133 RepID=A2ER67_TRIV3|nr:mismatch repair protein Mlh1B (MutL-like protein) [Trichomonas vaginalis G3]EAY04820.1 DNA mismatch repair protein, putative [Trichomonas vaginalis G3]KAI5535340.1 mismatch repair protein Mlh1B (MutL-like protein) [Trichomonas vaginalis G3]|eukprot:XP_001317043.1 DNA mismatch repair protein [Trichomonas vaginalis G3]